MAQQSDKYYRPYDSGSDSDSDYSISSGTTDSTDSTDSSFNTTSGPNFINLAKILNRGTNTKIPSSITQDASLPFVNLTLAPDPPKDSRYGQTVFATENSRETTIISIDSKNRDKQIYPQPTRCTFRIPRTYKNILSISVAEIKLLTSFFFFSKTNVNTDITIYEQGRQTIYNGVLQSTFVKSYINDGSYNINTLLSQLQTTLNKVPIFYDFINGFNDFIIPFRSTGDFSIALNEPGDTFYNRLTKSYVTNPTKELITTYYWGSRYANLKSYSIDNCTVAYYYPVLKENLTDTNNVDLTPGLNIDPDINSTLDVYNRCMYTFEGITDQIVLAIINANKNILDEYRLLNTFRYSLINKYNISVNEQSQYVTISSSGLNTSLVNTINTQQTKLLNQALSNYNLTRQQYITIQNTNARYSAVLESMQQFLQNQFRRYFGVPWSQYSFDYYMNTNNNILIRNGNNLNDVPSNDIEAFNAGIVTYTSSIFSSPSNNIYWPLNNLNTDTVSYLNLSNSTSTFNFVYSQSLNNIDINQPFIVSSNYIYSPLLTNTADVVCPIEAGKYTVFKFNSLVRQTIQIETLPTPIAYRLPLYNKLVYDSTINKYFNKSYLFLSNSSYQPLSNYTTAYDTITTNTLLEIPGWGTTSVQQTSPTYSWGLSYESSLSLYENALRINTNNINKSLYMQFTTPNVSNASPNSNYKYTINVKVNFYDSLITSNNILPSENYKAFIYHDRAAFMGDITCNRNENPYFYKYSMTIPSSNSDNTFSFLTYPNQTYYITVRPNELYAFPTRFVSIVPWVSTNTIISQDLSVSGLNPSNDVYLSSFSTLVNTNFNYAQIYDPNWIQLPINIPFNTSLQKPLSNKKTILPIGYDINGVSTDYTDYIPYNNNSLTESFSPKQSLAIDPINKFIFQSNSPYLNNQYLYSKGNNIVMYPGLSQEYTTGTVSNREYKIVHYYSVNYLPESENNSKYFLSSIIKNSTDQLAYNVNTTNGPIKGYNYSGPNSNIQFDSGILGFSFIPGYGKWNMKKLIFRSAISDYDKDPNQNISYLGVYLLQDIIDKNTRDINFSNAITILSNSARVTYTSNYSEMASGFDVKSGTYYEFTKDNSFNLTPGFSHILGYYQKPGTIISQPESIYAILPFTSNYQIYTIKALSGSAIPYPYYNDAFTSSVYIDGSKSYISSQGVVFPSTIGQTNWPSMTNLSSLFAPIGSETQSQYALSQPIGTSVLLYKKEYSLLVNSDILIPWSINITPTLVNANIKNYVLVMDTQINIYEYNPYNIVNLFSKNRATITIDEIYSIKENTSFIGLTANDSHYYFLGLSNTTLRLKQYHPEIGLFTELSLDSTYKIPKNGTVKSFTINNFDQIALAYHTPDNITRFYYTSNDYTGNLSSNIVPTGSAIHASASDISTIYWINTGNDGSGSNVYKWDLTSEFPGKLYTPNNPTITWNQIAVNSSNNNKFNENEIYLANTTINNNLYYSSDWSLNNFSTQIVALNSNLNIGSIDTGFSGSLWITDAINPLIWGNRNVEIDIPGNITAAWQIFYPFQKIVLESIDDEVYDPINNLKNLNYPEYNHTQLFYYDSLTNFSNDINGKWGQEQKYIQSDSKFNGYYFNSYINAIPIYKNNITNPQYIAVRGFTPTESSESLLRIVIPNKYTFGYITIDDIIKEINDSKINSNLYDNDYIDCLSNFNLEFKQDNIFGANIVPNFNGDKIITSNFRDYYTKISTLYGTTQTDIKKVTNIASYINTNLLSYAQTNLQYILPPNALTRKKVTSPILFSVLWNTGLLPQYKKLVDNWGLGYNLGFNNKDTIFSLIHQSQSFYKILDDYIYLRISPEYNINKIDITDKEQMNITRDSTGSIEQYFGKLLLSDFNTYSRTFVSNQVTFNPPIARLDKLSFEWLNSKGETINNNDCEWNASFAMTEFIIKQTVDSMIIKAPTNK